MAKTISEPPYHDLTKVRKNYFEKLLNFKEMKEDMIEIKPDYLANRNNSTFNFKNNITNLLENLFSYYQDIFKHNWAIMINTWYQNHRPIALLARKGTIDFPKSDKIFMQSNPMKAEQISRNLHNKI